MKYNKIKISSLSQLQVGDVFEVQHCTGNHRAVIAYEVCSAPIVTETPHRHFPEMMLKDVVFKGRDRRNGKGKTFRWADGEYTIWRK